MGAQGVKAHVLKASGDQPGFKYCLIVKRF